VDNKLSNLRQFTDMVLGATHGVADGIRADADGNIWAGCAGAPGYDGVQIFSPAGQRIGLIRLPETCANICFGGVRRDRLFMAASQSLYSLDVGTRGAPVA
jgi:gluconolactonase